MIQPLSLPTLSTETTFTEEEQLIEGIDVFAILWKLSNWFLKQKIVLDMIYSFQNMNLFQISISAIFRQLVIKVPSVLCCCCSPP